MELTEQQKKFCREYMKDFNGTQAAIRAGYSKKSAGEQATRLLGNVNAQKFITSLQGKAADKHEGLADEIVAELKKIGFSDIKKFLDSGNTIKDISQLPSELTTCVESVKKTETEFGDEERGGTKTSVQFKLHSKLDALEKLAKYVGLYEADNKQRGAVITVNIDDAD
jgi:phage terminase small subunit